VFSDRDLTQEISEVIESTLAEGNPTPAAWVANAVVQRHQRPDGADADFYLLCAHHHVRKLVQSALRRFNPSSDGSTDERLLLPGFERLQRFYLVTRDDDQVAVPIGQMSNGEIASKITELKAMSRGCMELADDLTKYRSNRPVSEAA